jgi:hypothetical protein
MRQLFDARFLFGIGDSAGERDHPAVDINDDVCVLQLFVLVYLAAYFTEEEEVIAA